MPFAVSPFAALDPFDTYEDTSRNANERSAESSTLKGQNKAQLGIDGLVSPKKTIINIDREELDNNQAYMSAEKIVSMNPKVKQK